MKVNVDGAFTFINNDTACGGIIRNEDGSMLKGFMKKLQGGDALFAEIEACISGLELA